MGTGRACGAMPDGKRVRTRHLTKAKKSRVASRMHDMLFLNLLAYFVVSAFMLGTAVFVRLLVSGC